ncbi:MAG: hypothetical protein WCG10_06060 [Chlamydiota bacterium]
MSILKIDPISIRDICGDSTQAFVYGFYHCKYGLMHDALKTTGSPIQRTFSGVPDNPYSYDCQLTLEKTPLEVISERDPTSPLKRYCKNGVASAVIENMHRKATGLEIIPFLFFIDITGNAYSAPNPISVTTKKTSLNKIITHSEMRRAYKLCHDKNVDPQVQSVARETFHFIKLNATNKLCTLEEQPAPWEQNGWDEAWSERKKVSVSIPKEPKNNWRYQVNRLVEREEPVSTDAVVLTQSAKMREVLLRIHPNHAWNLVKDGDDSVKNDLEFVIAVLEKSSPENAHLVLQYAGNSLKKDLRFVTAVLQKSSPENVWEVVKSADDSLKDNLEFATVALQKSSSLKTWLLLLHTGPSVKNDLGFMKTVLHQCSRAAAAGVLRYAGDPLKNNLEFVTAVLHKCLEEDIEEVMKSTKDPLKNNPNFARACFYNISLDQHARYKDYNPIFTQIYSEIHDQKLRITKANTCKCSIM